MKKKNTPLKQKPSQKKTVNPISIEEMEALLERVLESKARSLIRIEWDKLYVEVVQKSISQVVQKQIILYGAHSIEKRFDKLDQKLAEMNNDMLSGFDRVYKKIETLEQENTVIDHQLKETDLTLEDMQKKIKSVEARVNL